MIVSKTPLLHLTYCQNIHAGETWLEHYRALQEKAVAVKAALGVDEPFGLGLRISATAAAELQSPEALDQGRSLFAEHNLYPFSINGFPYGRFHRGPVKADVYAPDWRTPERVQYTGALGKTLASWLPEGIEGSISTVPGSYAPWIQSHADELSMARHLGSIAAAFAAVERDTGRRVHLGLEPEPDCFLETTAQTLAFFKTALPEGALPEIRRILSCTAAEAETLLRRHIGVCFDTCHVALQYENLADSLRAFRDAGVLLSKIQLSAALQAPATPETYAALSAFREPVYLHQVKGLAGDGTVRSWPDLAEALEALPSTTGLKELRVHFHVPLFVSPNAPLASTAGALDEAFWKEVRTGICPHLEIETYTFDVLPPEVHPGDIVKSIAEEYRWVLQKLTP